MYRINKKCTSANERFHASGGAVSSDTEQVTALFALVRALPNPRLREAATTLSASGVQHSGTMKSENKG